MDALNRPRPERQPCPPHKVLPRNSKQTLREFITDNETNLQIIGVLKNLANTRPKGPWKAYLQFYVENQSGDTATMKPEVMAFAEKMLKDLKSEWAKQQGEDESEPVQVDSPKREVSRSGEAGEDKPQSGGRVRQGKQG